MTETDPERPTVRTWYVLHVKPRTEKKVHERLGIMGVFHYLPLYKKVTKVQRRRVVRYLPLFPGYVFTRLFPDERIEILKTQNIVRTIEVNAPRRMIHQLRQIAHAGALPDELRKVERFEVNEHVRVQSGPLRGVEGYVQRVDGVTSIVLLLDILGQAVETRVNPVDLEKI